MKFIQLSQLDVRDIRGAGVHRTAIEYCDYAVGGLVRARCPRTGKVLNMCIPASEGCRNCYASAITARFHPGRDYSAQNAQAVEWFFDEAAAKSVLNFRPKGPYKNGRTRPAVFLGDMTDPFGPWVTDAWLDRKLAVCALRPDVDFLILTKRPERMAEYMTRREMLPGWRGEVRAGGGGDPACMKWKTPCDRVYTIARQWKGREAAPDLIWPLPNVWLGCSVENRKTLERINDLRRCPAAVRFVSFEPLLEDLGDIGHHLRLLGHQSEPWAIVGGESGGGARPCDAKWIMNIVFECRDADVPCYVKQLGKRPFDTRGPGLMLDTREQVIAATAMHLDDSKGGDMDKWPEALRVREMPKGVPA